MDASDPADEPPRHQQRNRGSAESKLRRGGKHCPVCLAPLRKNARRTRVMRACTVCEAHVSHQKRCSRCGAEALWENKSGAACQSCGLYGAKIAVIVAEPSDRADVALAPHRVSGPRGTEKRPHGTDGWLG
jgi:hypothetical protein